MAAKLSLSTKHEHFDSFVFDIMKFISPSKYSVSQPASQSASNLKVFQVGGYSGYEGHES